MEFISCMVGVSCLNMFNSVCHNEHSGQKWNLNVTNLLWGYESYQEAQLYADAYFQWEVDVFYDTTKHVKKKDEKLCSACVHVLQARNDYLHVFH